MSPVTVLGGVVRRSHPSSPSTASSCSGPPPDRSAAADAPAPKPEAPTDDDLHFDRRETKGKHFVRRVCTSTPKPDAGGRPGHRRRKRGR